MTSRYSFKTHISILMATNSRRTHLKQCLQTMTSQMRWV